MTTLAIQFGPLTHPVLIKPEPRGGPIAIRQAVPGDAADLAFIDSLQRMHDHMVGWMPTKQLESYISRGEVLIAEDDRNNPVGYCLYRDKYFKREDCGIIYQLNIAPGHQRGLIGASLIKAAFERSAYGCKLYCCWCAQDIQANHFWESMGFVPLAFRTGSRRKQRIHIFWQRRVRENDQATPWWFPSQTTAGAVAEDRLVLPIPPGTHWSDAKPMVLPGMEGEATNALPEGEAAKKPGGRVSKNKMATALPSGPAPKKPAGGLWFGPPAGTAQVKAEQMQAGKINEPKQRVRQSKQKHDPKLIAAARELRDRYLEQINDPHERMLPVGGTHGKYDVSKRFAPQAAPPTTIQQTPLLKAA